jgi:mRNA interferase MazF
MPVFEPGQIVRVPFPYSDGVATQHRPALVVACPGDGFLLWVLMVTSAENRPWPGDVAIPDHRSCGLPAPSIVRSEKIATIDASKADLRGVVPAGVLAQVRKRLGALLAV